jgi:(p)ppGpp synthase/HD superfamily hydrolase
VIFEAIDFAVAAHRGQNRKGSRTPYVLHPLAAARILLEAGCAEHLAVAAVLHDVIEDTSIKAEELAARFGARVTELVLLATEPDKWQSWEERKGHTLRRLEATADEEALLVTLADKLDNIESIRGALDNSGEEVWRRFKRGRQQQKWYYCSLRDVYMAKLLNQPGRGLAARFDSHVRAVFGG